MFDYSAIAIDLIFTVILYGTGPLLFAKLRKKPVRIGKVRAFSVVYSFMAWICSNVLLVLLADATVSSGGAAVLWGAVFYKVSKRILAKRSMIEPEPILIQENADTVQEVSAEPEPQPETMVRELVQVPQEEPSPDLQDPKPKRWFTALTVVILIACVLLAASTCFFYTQANSNMEEAEKLESKNEELQGKLQSARELYQSAKNQINKLVIENSELSDKLSMFEGRIGDMADSYYFFRSNIGFIIEGSNRYHNYNCSIFQNSDTYWAHNIEYCEYLGYSKCPECW